MKENKDNVVNISRDMTDSEKLDLLISEFCGMRADISVMKTDIAELKEKVGNLETKVTKLEENTEAMRGDIESHMWPAIKVIGEGHMDLFKGINELKSRFDLYEMILIRISLVERNVDELKKKVS